MSARHCLKSVFSAEKTLLCTIDAQDWLSPSAGEAIYCNRSLNMQYIQARRNRTRRPQMRVCRKNSVMPWCVTTAPLTDSTATPRANQACGFDMDWTLAQVSRGGHLGRCCLLQQILHDNCIVSLQSRARTCVPLSWHGCADREIPI